MPGITAFVDKGNLDQGLASPRREMKEAIDLAVKAFKKKPVRAA